MKRNLENRLILLLRRDLVQNVLSLYGVQIASYIVPLITIPYLARVLGAAGWGLVAFAQAFGGYLNMVIEYGFNLSGTREIARHRNDQGRLADVLGGVLGAKGFLVLPAVIAAVTARHWVAIFRAHPALFWAAVFWTIAQSFSMLWYFQGLERMQLVAALDVSTKALATGAVFLLVHVRGDEWKVLALQGAAAFLSTLIGTALAYREVPFRLPTWRLTLEALRMGWSMFLFRGAVSLYTVGNAFVLGLFASPELVGYYAGAEKISKALLNLLQPVPQAFYPRLSHLVEHARDQAARLARLGVMIMGIGGIVFGLVVFIFAPLLIRVTLGHGYAPAVPVLRVLALLPPLIALSNVFGIQWMLPLGMDRIFNTIILIAGVINLSLAFLLAPRYTALGMAVAVVIAETIVTGGIYAVLRIRKLDPMTYLANLEKERMLESQYAK